MKSATWIVVALALGTLTPALAPSLAAAQDKKAPEPIAAEAEAIQEAAGGEEAPEPTPEPTPAERSFECAVDSTGERCTVPISEGDSVVGVVAYKEEHTGEWVDFGWGPFNAEDQPHGCDWTLSFKERLVEEVGCFENGKRHGPWQTCRLRIDPKAGGIAPRNPNQKCPTTEYENGLIVVKAPEPAEGEEAEAEGEEAAEGEEGAESEESKKGEEGAKKKS